MNKQRIVIKTALEFLSNISRSDFLINHGLGNPVALGTLVLGALGLAGGDLYAALKKSGSRDDFRAIIDDLAEKQDASLRTGVLAQPAAIALAFDRVVEMGTLQAAKLPLDDIRRPWLMLLEWIDEKFRTAANAQDATRLIGESIRDGIDTRFGLLSAEQRELFKRQNKEYRQHAQKTLATLNVQLADISSGVTDTFRKVSDVHNLVDKHGILHTEEHGKIFDAIMELPVRVAKVITKKISDVPPAQPSNLPGGYFGSLFLGRDGFLGEIHNSLSSQELPATITQKTSATAISGLGGIGKTHAAVEYAHRHRHEYNALLFVSGDSPEKFHFSLASLCEVLLGEIGNLPPDQEGRLRAVLDWLARRPGWLLIIDNVDNEPAAKALIDLLGKLTAGHLLITSRLQHWPNQIKHLDLEVLSKDDSTALLLQLTGNCRRSVSDDESQARQLAELLDGLPLAIHQAAGYINEQGISLSAYVTRYGEEAATLLNWFSDHLISYERPERFAPRPVLITWKASFDMLSKTDQLWLLVFSHLAPDPIPEFLLEPREDAAPELKSILREASDGIASAAKYCLLTRSRDEPVFKLHRLVQQITRLQQTDPPLSRVEAHKKIVTAILGSGACDEDEIQTVNNLKRWALLEPHVRVIHDSISDDEIDEDYLSLREFFAIHLGESGRTKEGVEIHQKDFDWLKTNNVGGRILGETSQNLALALDQSKSTSEEFAKIEELYRISINAYKGESQSSVGLATALGNYGSFLDDSKRWEEAIDHLNEAMVIARKCPACGKEWTAWVLYLLVYTEIRQGKLDSALKHARKAIAIYEELNENAKNNAKTRHDEGWQCTIRVCLADALLANGNYQEALDQGQEALRRLKELFENDPTEWMPASRCCAEALIKLGRLEEAKNYAWCCLAAYGWFYSRNQANFSTYKEKALPLLRMLNEAGVTRSMAEGGIIAKLKKFQVNEWNEMNAEWLSNTLDASSMSGKVEGFKDMEQVSLSEPTNPSES